MKPLLYLFGLGNIGAPP